LNVSPYRGDSHGFSALLVAVGTIFHVQTAVDFDG
jgi:hypothetical protein